MPFVIQQSLIEKTFIKVGQELGENLDLNSSQNAVAFLSGLVDSLRKEAHMNPSQALGFMKYLTEVGYNNAKINKNASVEDGNELDEVFAEMQEKIAFDVLAPAKYIWNQTGQKIVNKGMEAQGRGMANQLTENFKSEMGNIGDQIGGFATKAWDHLKSPEFLGQVAPYAIGALGGYLIPKLLGGGGNGLVNAGLGAAAVGGGAYLANKYKLTDPETWKGFKNQAMNFIGGGQKQAGLAGNNKTLENPFGGINQYRGLPTGLTGGPASQNPFGTGGGWDLGIGGGNHQMPSVFTQPHNPIPRESFYA